MILPSHLSYTVQEQLIGGGVAETETPFTLFQKKLYHRNDFEAVILREKVTYIMLL